MIILESSSSSVTEDVLEEGAVEDEDDEGYEDTYSRGRRLFPLKSNSHFYNTVLHVSQIFLYTKVQSW